ncbi:tRNA (adenosine(37)-N6)-threonylcarbamoyltransferase complex ATPase subunit type 1 TsaE [Mangrovicoccus algicola]|uniref:tRNA threonylcarbamoyladenosine biosynthesis protein TsaE n=1 Tax=Mangrovicoccus algicola TaxID=2771008 RepID=A0A8J6ZF65_9RHOB|nr:tRNA (adenosine(37)-N6)-threonylcarbamoyltransferase complex ATPase subunit type 1 TsaE [Mangrovicoccus algicola]MBE3640325.1 tRNA (adenosine(37)-N6)-threonylcarbamoyltransferase complex ATPase subunit type 1 TsaE [Mangrovicoccus algicola]
MSPIPPLSARLRLQTAEATAALARRLAPLLGAGDVLALSGPVGAGKSTFARALIKHLLAREGRDEDVPSPTFTLVQSYDAAGVEIWHCDLYRLTHADEVLELGLDAAFEEALCLVEWPDRLGGDLPCTALSLDFAPDPQGEARNLTVTWSDDRWSPRLSLLAEIPHAD